MDRKILYVRSVVVGRELSAEYVPFIGINPMLPWMIHEVRYRNKYHLPEEDQEAIKLFSGLPVEIVDLCFAPLMVRFHAFLAGISKTPTLLINDEKTVGLDAIVVSLTCPP